MEDMVFCQSCGMLMPDDQLYGTEKDGSKTADYCTYCYQAGAFTEDVSMDEMMAISLKHMKEGGVLEQMGQTEAQAEQMMKEFFPQLKRWQQ